MGASTVGTIGIPISREHVMEEESRPDGTESPAGRIRLGHGSLRRGDVVPRATSFSCVSSVPCSLPGWTEAMKACAGPGQRPSQLCLSAACAAIYPEGARTPPFLPSTKETKLFTGCSGSQLPWGCQMYLVVIGTLLPWLCSCCAWQRRGWSIRKVVYTGVVILVNSRRPQL